MKQYERRHGKYAFLVLIIECLFTKIKLYSEYLLCSVMKLKGPKLLVFVYCELHLGIWIMEKW